jgi:hypothetical protein
MRVPCKGIHSPLMRAARTLPSSSVGRMSSGRPSRDTRSTMPYSHRAFGVCECACAKASKAPGSIQSSSSRKWRNVPVAASAPTLRPTAGRDRGAGVRTMRTRPDSIHPSRRSELSVSFTTTTSASKPSPYCVNTLSTARRSSSRPTVGMTVEIRSSSVSVCACARRVGVRHLEGDVVGICCIFFSGTLQLGQDRGSVHQTSS